MAAYKTTFRPRELIRADELNENFRLLQQGMPFDPDAIKSEIIKNGSIKLEDLNEEVLNKIGLSSLEWKQENFIVQNETQFELQDTPIENTEIVFLNGIQQLKDIFYTINNKNIVIVNPEDIANGDILSIKYAKSVI